MRRLLLATAFAVPLMGCLEDKPRPAQGADNRHQQERAAVAAAQSVQFNANAEIENIKKRLELTSNPSLLGYIILLNDAGQPIIYEGVMGKVTSGNKRLNPADQVSQHSAYGNNGGLQNLVRQAPSDEGTHGSSAPYIFYWTPDGAYRQWSGQYLYSDKPIRLRVQPLVINIEEPPSALKKP